jgi:hypothetical protein
VRRFLRIALGIVGGLVLGVPIGGVCGLMAGQMLQPRGWLTAATSARAWPWVFGGIVPGMALGMWLGLRRAMEIPDLDAEINEDLDDVESDKWGANDRDIL